jgi:hypothetical protein
MEDSKLQALHDALSQLRGQKGLGSNSQYSWQRGTCAPTTRHAAAVKLPDNALYAHFLPEGVYDPKSSPANDGDGRVIKRDFSDAIGGDDGFFRSSVTLEGSLEKAQRRALRKAEKKDAKKEVKLKAKREAKLEEKKRQKKLAKKLLKKQSSLFSENTSTCAISDADKSDRIQTSGLSTPFVISTSASDNNVTERSRSEKKREKSPSVKRKYNAEVSLEDEKSSSKKEKKKRRKNPR